MPRDSRRSAAPLLDVAARFPCLMVRAPAAVVMMAAVVEILIVFAPSPPVPTISTARSGISMRDALRYMESTRALTSFVVSPFSLRARRNFFVFSVELAPSRISFIAHSIWRALNSDFVARLAKTSSHVGDEEFIIYAVTRDLRKISATVVAIVKGSIG